MRFVFATCALMMMSFRAQAGAPNYADLIGTWRVSAVAVNSDGMQALQIDDPQFMGAVVQFGADKIVWLKGTPSRRIDPAADNCEGAPRLTPAIARNPETIFQVDGGFNVVCGGYGWGPGAVIRPADDGTVALYWYDNGVLTLKRDK